MMLILGPVMGTSHCCAGPAGGRESTWSEGA